MLMAAGAAFGGLSAATASIVGSPTKALCPPGGKVLTIGYDTFSDSQEFAAARWKGLQNWQKTLGCVKFIKLTDNADGSTALSNVKIFVNRNVDGVLLLQVVASAQAGIVNLLKSHHIPVMATDIAAPNTPYLSASDHLVGVQAGRALAAGYKKLHTTTQPWLVLGTIPPAGPAVQRRMDGAKTTLQQLLHIPNNHVISLPINQQTGADAFNAMRSSDSLIPSNAPVLLTADNDELTLGAYRELKQSGKGRKLVVVGIGGLSAGLKSVCKYPDWAGTVDFAPYKQTGYIVSEMLALMKGQKVPANFYTPTQVVNRALVKKLYPEDCK
jgi:ABC-type sugar transport system substrate-binding protein